jgi:hypothetical protein
MTFLFNIYINEFDKFIYYLILDYNRSKIYFTISKMLQKNCNYNLKIKVSKNYIKQFQKILNDKKKGYYNKYKHYKLTKGQILQYIRYSSFLFIGICGTYLLALKTKQKINRFLKSDLHLKIKQSTLIKKSNKNITFFNFILYFPIFLKKKKEK